MRQHRQAAQAGSPGRQPDRCGRPSRQPAGREPHAAAADRFSAKVHKIPTTPTRRSSPPTNCAKGGRSGASSVFPFFFLQHATAEEVPPQMEGGNQIHRESAGSDHSANLIKWYWPRACSMGVSRFGQPRKTYLLSLCIADKPFLVIGTYTRPCCEGGHSSRAGELCSDNLPAQLFRLTECAHPHADAASPPQRSVGHGEQGGAGLYPCDTASTMTVGNKTCRTDIKVV